MGLTPVPDDHVAAIVTSLEMTGRPITPPSPDSELTLVRWRHPKPEAYRALFRRVGRPWLWFSRLLLDDAALLAIIGDESVEVYAVTDAQGLEVGILELDFRQAPHCEIAYFGLVPECTGRGHGRWLMGQALDHAWRVGVDRVWVHTCTLDHPSALGLYRSQGFTPFERRVETFADPRLSGALPLDAAPQVPLLTRR